MKYLTPELELIKFQTMDVLGSSELAADTNENWQTPGNDKVNPLDPLQF